MSSFNALDRNSSLIKTEEECRATVPLELDQMTPLYSGWGHSNCLPLPEMGVSIRVGVSQLSFHHFHTYRCQRRTKTAPVAGATVHHLADFGRSKSAPFFGM